MDQVLAFPSTSNWIFTRHFFENLEPRLVNGMKRWHFSCLSNLCRNDIFLRFRRQNTVLYFVDAKMRNSNGTAKTARWRFDGSTWIESINCSFCSSCFSQQENFWDILRRTDKETDVLLIKVTAPSSTQCCLYNLVHRAHNCLLNKPVTQSLW